MPFKCENMQNKHISGLSISVLPFSSLCFDSSLLVSFPTFGLFRMGCALKDGENYFYFWHQQHPKHSDLETVPFPNKEEKLRGRGTTKLNFLFFSPLPPAKCNLKQSRCVWGIVSACLPPQDFKANEVSGNLKRRKFRKMGCHILGCTKLGEKHEKTTSFSQKTSVWGKLNFSLKMCSQGKSPTTSAPLLLPMTLTHGVF